MTKNRGETQYIGLPPEKILSSLERILASEEFADSAQLSRFLRFAVESRLSGTTDRLKESIIGTTVFRRGPDFDPKSDPIVRVEARRLRARLESYYSRVDGREMEDAVKIVLPKGGYAPVFEPWPPAPQTSTVDVVVGLHEEPSPPAAPRRKGWILPVAALLSAAAIAAVLRMAQPAPLPVQFWSSLLAGSRPALLIPGDTGLVMFQDLVHHPVPLREYILGEFRTPYANDKALTEGISWDFAGRRYTPAGDLEFAVELARRPEAGRRGFLTRFARDVRPEDLQNGNLILLGPRHMNPWVELFEKDATFRLDHDETTSDYRLINTRPAPGEIHDAVITPLDARTAIYGIVNYHREGSRDVLMLSGTAVAGTEAAAHFVADDNQLLPILEKSRKNGHIRDFDLLLRGRNLAGSSPQVSVVALHIEP